MTRAYEYHLVFWGEVKNERWIERDLGITATNFWFASASDRATFKALLKACAASHNCIIVFSEHEGCDVRLRTVARMTMRLPDGREFDNARYFGFGYPVEAAEWAFTGGNYSCDCNRSKFLREDDHDVEEFGCGETIKLVKFAVRKEADL